MAKRGRVDKKLAKGKAERPLRIKTYKYIFLIVCEDEKTEPQYFKQFVSLFPERTLYLKPIGSGSQWLGVIDRAIQEKVNLSLEVKREVDYVWVVFDRDDAHLKESTTKIFNEALIKAQEQEFKIAYSNEVFELWLLLHLEDMPCSQSENTIYSALHRNDIYTNLQEAIRKYPNYSSYIYDHRKPAKDQKNIIEVIQEIGNESEAIKRAEVILEAQLGIPEIFANPSTKVHLLVKEIRE